MYLQLKTYKLEFINIFLQVGGMDVSFVKENRNMACAYFAVLSYPDFKVGNII